MATLLPINIADLIVSVRDVLQDSTGTRWTDQELYRYIDQANRDIAVRLKNNNQVDNIDVVAGTTDYQLNYQAIEFHKIVTSQHYEILDNATIKFKDSMPETVVVDYYAYPARVVFGVDTTLTLEEGLYDCIIEYVLHKCYRKEASTQNLNKAQAFFGSYISLLSLQPRSGGQSTVDVQPHKSDFL